MNADQQAAPGATSWDPGHVELTVQMDLGSAPLTLDALQSLQEGFIFELDVPPAAPVMARINGVAIGQGELIRIGDKLGVRLVKVLSHAD